MAEIIARTERLLLRTEAAGDQHIWRAHINVPAAMAHLGGVRTDDEIAAKFQRNADRWARHGFCGMLLERRSDGLLLGQCGLGRIERDEAPAGLRGQMEIGWMLRPDCWGQGYALEAARCVVALAFERYGAATLFGQTSQGNSASLRLMARLGMTRRADLDYVDPIYPPGDNPTIIHELSGARWRAGETAKETPEP
ncbi:MAG TPA: GNAT family N-acetyltransferase [Sphingobium sp.]|nr:GNAT family N-acetyltransferase [Sphingobium sp.]